MDAKATEKAIIGPDQLILITGATGFIGSRLVQNLVGRGFRKLRCFVRSSARARQFENYDELQKNGSRIEIFKGNLLSRADCIAATKDAAVIYHLAAGRGEKSFPDAFLNSVVTTRNLIEAALQHNCMKRLVNMSSFAVYKNEAREAGRRLDESCPVESQPELRGDAYCFAKVKQDELVSQYGEKFGLPYVTVRPGAVYGPGNLPIPGRVGIGSFGLFLHCGGSNRIPFTFIENCVDAIVLAGLTPGIDREIFNVVDDDLPSSRRFLRLYKRNVKQFHSLYLPHSISYALCFLWEKYSAWSYGQLPNSFNRKKWYSFWRKTCYSNNKIKSRLGWTQRVTTSEGLDRYFEACRIGKQHA
jgi:nucleoside-diphosphate-sugar epimerase